MQNQSYQETVNMFSHLFSKPKVTEQLLSKPPFKFLLDVISQTIKTTDFAKNLYKPEEFSRDFYDTREKKIDFFRKIIALTSLMLNQEIEARPTKIIAGVEPEKTNLFLQAMYKAATSGKSSDAYVKKVNAMFEIQELGRTSPEEILREEPQRSSAEEKPRSEEIRMVRRPGGGQKIPKAEAISEPKGTTVAGSSQNEVEVIQKLIQNVTQNINPLGKTIDYVDDDIEIMNKEREFWRKDFLSSKVKGQEEQANTEDHLQPLQNMLAEIEKLIQEKKCHIQSVKPHILQNEQRIHKLLYSATGNK